MEVFLAGTITENISGREDLGVITERNGFGRELRSVWKQPSRCLYVCSIPGAYSANDAESVYYRDSLIRSGFGVSSFDLCDGRYAGDFNFERLASYDVIILGCGRTESQNRFIAGLRLREFFADRAVQGSSRVVIGISAGALNCAETTYNWPEEEGDTAEDVPRFLPGLGLVRTQVLPHFQTRNGYRVDGRDLCGDITARDSIGHEFVALPDFSYVEKLGEQEVIRGPYGRYQDGVYCCGAKNSMIF